jgi:hypothetical protein
MTIYYLQYSEIQPETDQIPLTTLQQNQKNGKFQEKYSLLDLYDVESVSSIENILAILPRKSTPFSQANTLPIQASILIVYVRLFTRSSLLTIPT